jgi:hypothetical protein
MLLRGAPIELPRPLDEEAARALTAAIAGAGGDAEVVAADERSTIACATHPSLRQDGSCARCENRICALCRLDMGLAGRPHVGGGMALCRACLARERRRRRFTRGRVAALLLVLSAVALWGLRVTHRRSARLDWNRTLAVEVALLIRGATPYTVSDGLRSRLPELEQFFDREVARYRPGTPRPFRFVALDPIAVATAPPMPPPEEALLDRARYMLALNDYLAPIDARIARAPHDVRLYLVLSPPELGQAQFMEGAGAAGGDFGIVLATVDAKTIELALIGLGHELLHCIGASDKYDTRGHSVAPAGLCEPDAVPRYPQRCAELMAGETALAPDTGRLASELSEVRVGAVTAREIGWLH